MSPATTPSSNPSPPGLPRSGSRGRPRRSLWLAVTIGGACLLLGMWLVVTKLPQWLVSPPDQPGGATPAGDAADSRKIHATLFYVSDDGSELVPMSREVPYAATPGEQARRIAEAQVQAPPDGFVSAIPAGTTVRGLYITPKGEAYIDLSHEIISGHTGGSLGEALTVYAIVNALTVNMADVSSVQILVNGKEVDTLVGHLDLRHPLNRSLKWVRKAQQ